MSILIALAAYNYFILTLHNYLSSSSMVKCGCDRAWSGLLYPVSDIDKQFTLIEQPNILLKRLADLT